MPIPEDKLRRPEKLHIWFAVSSVFMLASLLWLIQVDYARPWRDHQDDFFLAKAAFAHLDYLTTTTDAREQEIALARQALEAAREHDRVNNVAARQQIQAELDEAAFAFKKADAPFSRVSQVLQVSHDTYERALGAHGPDHPTTIAAKSRLDAEREELEALRRAKEESEDAKKRLTRQLRDLDAVVVAAEKRLAALQQAQTDALKRDQQFRGVLTDKGMFGGIPLVKAIFNMPLLDFAAPKNTPARHEVKQLVLPGIEQNLNYLRTYTTDRCTTCHIAIDDPEFSQETLARKIERSLGAINETLVKAGQPAVDYPPPPVLSGALQTTKLQPGGVVAHWDVLSTTQRNEYFSGLVDGMNRYLKATGRQPVELRQPLLAHPNLDLFVSVDSPHPMAMVGCTVCHEGNPQETDFILAAHSPTSHKVREDWRDRYYVTRLGVPMTTFETIEHYWDRPMYPPVYSEAGCAKCHTQVSDIDEFEGEQAGQRINHGRYLFTSVGCVNCHSVDKLPDAPRVGPDLSHVREKLSPAFVQQWVWQPQDFRPSTRMPHFFLQENNRAEGANELDPHPVLRTETEVAAISKYLFAVSKPWNPLPMPTDITGDAQRGRDLFRNVGCLACHANLGEFGEEWISKDLMARLGLDQERAAARYKGMTDEERIRYAMENFVSFEETFFDPDQNRFSPDKPYTPPVFTRFAPELSGVGSKLSRQWLFSWLIKPWHYSPETKMPSLRLSEQEALDITEYLLSFKNDSFEQAEFEWNDERRAMADELVFKLLSAQRSAGASQAIMRGESDELAGMISSLLSTSLGGESAKSLVAGWPLEDQKHIFLGSKMISHYGCYACHTIPGFEQATPPGTDLSTWAQKPVGQLDFAFFGHAFHDMHHEKEDVYHWIYPRGDQLLAKLSPAYAMAQEITHTHAAFAKHKMLNPRIWDREKIKGPYDKLKMPNFYFTEEESIALTTYLLSRTDPRVKGSLLVDYTADHAGPIADGRDLTRELNCVGCHQTENNVPTIQQYYRRDIAGQFKLDVTNAPPSLVGEGAKLQHNWFHGFLLNVEPLRPWLQVRMPSFNINGEEATTLVEYFAALSQRDAEQLAKLEAPVKERLARSPDYIGWVHGGAQDQNRDQPLPEGADWFQSDSLARSAAALARFVTRRELLRAADLDPLQTTDRELAVNYAQMLQRVDFMRGVYDVQYPFVEPARPLSSGERFAEGFDFLGAMGCLKCHVLGNMLPGPATTTDEFVQVYRLDGVTGEGDKAQAILNGRPYPIGSVIDGHTLISAENAYNMTGDVTTTAVVEGPNPQGEKERVTLRAASAPNLSLTHRRLRRDWVHWWMIGPSLIQPGTKMPTNFQQGRSPYEEPVAFSIDYSFRRDLDAKRLTDELRAKFPADVLSDKAIIEVAAPGDKWYIVESADLARIEKNSVLHVGGPNDGSPAEIELAAPSAAPSGDEFEDDAPVNPVAELDQRRIPASVRAALVGKGVELPSSAAVIVEEAGRRWSIRTEAAFTVKNAGDRLDVYQGRVAFTGTGDDHIQLLVDFLYDAGTKGTRAPLFKSVVPVGGGEEVPFEE
jgi:cbb3-type cytochrome oxidase cytochrome c subunit